jgi:alpha-glucosidase (family GH31 glycosyl hydrolase)
MKTPFSALLVTLLAMVCLGNVHADTVWLDDLSLSTVTQDWNKPHANQSVGGHPLKIGGKVFQRGLGTQARFWFPISLNGGGLSFTGEAGMDDEVIGSPFSSVEFIVHGDGKELWKSGAMRTGEPAKEFSINLAGVKTLVLEVTNSGDKNQYDHTDWANAKFETVAGQPLTTLADSKPGWSPIQKEAALTKLGGVTGIQKTSNGVLIENREGRMKITVCSPSVLRLQLTKGTDLPKDPQQLPGGMLPLKADFAVSEDDRRITLKTAELQLCVVRDSGSVTLLDKAGKPLLKEHGAGIQCGIGGKGYALEMGLGAGEHIFGHGDVAGPLDHRIMKNIRMAVEYRPRNVCVPFFMSTAGYGMFLNDTSQSLRFDYFGENPDGYYTASCDDGALDCFLIGGPDLKQIIAHYTATVVGRAPLIPRYGFGVMWSMKSNCDYAEAIKVATRFREEDLPLDSVQFEPGPGYATYIPKDSGKSEKETLEALAALNYHVAAWTGHYPHFWQDHKQWLDWGLDWVKVDPARRNYRSNASHDADALTMMKEFTDLSGGRRPFLSDCAGSTLATRHPSIRMCDRAGRTSTWQSMMNTAMTGVPYFFCDYWCKKNAGLYPGMPDDPTQNIWSRETIPQNIFLPTVNGQSWSYTYLIGFPWEQGDEWMNAYRYYAKLRYRLLPYYYSCAAECTLLTGIPMTRPLALEFESDPNTYGIDSDEFMFGDSLLVAFAYAEMKGSREVYLPAGARWLDYWSGQEFEGGQRVKLTIPERGPVNLCGLYVRAGAIIPMGTEVTWLDTEVKKKFPQKTENPLLLDIYPNGISTFRMYEDDGTTMNYTKGESCVTPIRCEQLARSTILTIEPRSGDYKPAARFYILKFNGSSKPQRLKLNGVVLNFCESYHALVAAKSGWFFGAGAPLINGPAGFTLSASPDTAWVKIPDTGERLTLAIEK